MTQKSKLLAAALILSMPCALAGSSAFAQESDASAPQYSEATPPQEDWKSEISPQYQPPQELIIHAPEYGKFVAPEAAVRPNEQFQGENVQGETSLHQTRQEVPLGAQNPVYMPDNTVGAPAELADPNVPKSQLTQIQRSRRIMPSQQPPVENRMQGVKKFDPAQSPDWAKERLKMRYFTQDGTEHHGTGDEYGFFN